MHDKRTGPEHPIKNTAKDHHTGCMHPSAENIVKIVSFVTFSQTSIMNV